MKIDNSTYKAIKQEREYNKKPHYSKGEYGHARANKNRKLLLTIVLFLMILSDVLISLIVFQTRKTWFIIIGCVMAIPFARNIIDFYMALKSTPLSDELYKKTDELSKNQGKSFLYDISITDTDGMIFIPCMCIENNNIIAFTPDAGDSKQREKIKSYINTANVELSCSYRIFVTERFDTFSKEIKKLNPAETEVQDDKMKDKILSMGF